MLISFRRTRATASTRSTAHGTARTLLGLALVAAPLLFQASTARAQDSASGAPPPTPLQRQLNHLDLGISGFGSYTKDTSGPVTVSTAPNFNANLTLQASTTVGYLINLRYIAKPYVGFEFNYGYARYSENYSYINGAIQTNATEYTVGYIAHPNHLIAGVIHPFLGAGAGTIAFRPTTGGGQGLRPQARAAYYYNVGLEAPVSEHFGLRVQFRQAFFLAPDFGQNYLTNLKRTYTIEPAAGFYLHF